jgi:hypothetical protein
VSPVIVTPIQGWGYQENIDGDLSPPFAVQIAAAGTFLAINVRGWRGKVVSPSAKYRDMAVEMSPRHVDWDGVVNITVFDGDQIVFAGMANTTELDLSWK